MKFTRIALRCGLLVAAAVSLALLAQARFPQPHEEYQARRVKLRARVDGPIVLYGYTGHEDASEVAVFFQEPNFYYLTGHDEPGAALVLIPDQPAGQALAGPREILYLPERDLASERWEGPKIGPDDSGVAAAVGFEAVEPLTNLKPDLQKLAKTFTNFYTILPPRREEGYPHFTESVAKLREAIPDAQWKDAAPAIYAMRQVKSPGEITLLQKAVDASVDAQLDAMKQMRPGLYEYQIAARMKMIHEWEGCSREAYAPIVGTGFNSTVLHYGALDAQIQDGDLVVLDVSGEYGSYAADVTRTLPANGKFSPRQREIYEIVLGAQNAAMAAVKPGVRIMGGAGSLMQISYDYINTHGKDKDGNPLGKYYIHGVGHHLGLDVHDPGSFTRPLEPGMVFTIEPGIYIPEEKLGVRIEDDVLLTETGPALMTAKLPRDPDEVEKMMASGRPNPLP
ncbi:MAG TPA: Xaa-Pro peptidase family protein [Candidatus Acidoferrales bacterium]|nr:Xaa-Pro peptidase family protein [Candidatus Acidoferrales bacterium]